MKTFYSLIANNVVASILNMTVWFAVIFYVFLQSRSVFATSLISGLFLVFTASTGFWFGSIVDHHKKKDSMLFSSVVSLFTYVGAFAMYLRAPENAFATVSSSYLWIFVTLLLLGVIAGNIRNIAMPTLVTLLVPTKERDKANGLVGTAGGIGFMVTSVISGFLVGHSGMTWVFILAIVGTILAYFQLLTINVPEKKIIHLEGASKKVDIAGTLSVIKKIPGLISLILFSTFNNFLGGVFMSLMDGYGLSLVSVETWGLLWGFLSTAFIIGGMVIAKRGLGKNPLRALMNANLIIWAISCVFTIYPSIILLTVGCFFYLAVVPFIEASEHTVFQKLVPPERQGRVFGFAQSVEQMASPLTAFAIGPITQFIFIPFMTTGAGVDLIGSWFGTGADRGIALVFTLAGIIGLMTTILARHSKFYHQLSDRYLAK
ncbi:MFS transporter [Candidatus Woesebacteria bacterium]|nr:MFS transporter [Candidatus Woesebacteria bacterium]